MSEIALLLFITGLIIFAFLLYCIISAINDSNHRKGNREEEHEGSPAKNKINYTVYYDSAFAIADAINSYRRDRQSDSRENSRREKYYIIIAAFTAIFGLSAVGAAIYSATLAIDQNDINRTSLVAVQRAFVNISSIETTSRAVTRGGGRKKFLIIQPVVTNDGNTPTRELRYVQGGSGTVIRPFPSGGQTEINTGEYVVGGRTSIEMGLAFKPPSRYFHPADPDALFSKKGGFSDSPSAPIKSVPLRKSDLRRRKCSGP